MSGSKFYQLPACCLPYNNQNQKASKTKGKQRLYYLPTELLLKLSYKPNMDLAESFPQSVGDMYNNSLPCTRDIDLTAPMQKEQE